MTICNQEKRPQTWLESQFDLLKEQGQECIQVQLRRQPKATIPQAMVLLAACSKTLPIMERNGSRPNSTSGASQRNGIGGGGGGGGGSNDPSNPNDIRRRIDSGNDDTSNLELQLAKLLLANRGSGGGGGNDPNLINSALGLPNAPSPRNPYPPKSN